MAKGKRLTEDEIKWILSVEANDAQSEILKLQKANENLIRQIRNVGI